MSPTTFNVTCELFDDHSFRIDQATVGYKNIRLRPGGVAKFKVKLEVGRKRGNYTAKLTAVTKKGARAIDLVDLAIK